MPKADPLHSFSPRRSPAILRDCVRDSAASKRRRTKGYPAELSLAFGMQITAMLWREPNIPPVQITLFPREDLRVRLSDHKPALAAVGFEPQTDQRWSWRLEALHLGHPLLVSDVGDTLLVCHTPAHHMKDFGYHAPHMIAFDPFPSPILARTADGEHRRRDPFPSDGLLDFSTPITAMIWIEDDVNPVQVIVYPREDLRVRLQDNEMALMEVGFQPQDGRRLVLAAGPPRLVRSTVRAPLEQGSYLGTHISSPPHSSATTEASAVGHQAEASVADTPVQSLDTEDVGSVPVYNYAPFLALDGNFQSKRRDMGLAKGEAFDNIDYSLSASLGYTVSTAIWLEYSTPCAYHLNSLVAQKPFVPRDGLFAAQILEASLSFNELLAELLDAQDEQWIALEGRFRPGGRVNVYDLGDDIWLEQFRLADIEMQFGWERSRFSRITRLTALIIWDRWKHLMRFDPNRLTREKLTEFAAAVHRNGAPLDLIAAMIDGTLRGNARPTRNQRILYNGWKRIHCLKRNRYPSLWSGRREASRRNSVSAERYHGDFRQAFLDSRWTCAIHLW
ncbi:hypothetical protein DFH09DRAFT_1290631 [Mycena vulgaris]|nr:hypothetical protein DFH09DRAFT_1290631 [Mycena vulgaris]